MSQKLENPILYRVTLCIPAEKLPQVHEAIKGLAAIVNMEHWYGTPHMTYPEPEVFPFVQHDEPVPEANDKPTKGKK